MLHACAVAAIAIAVAPAKVPTIEIAPGVDMPLVGIGTWQYDSMTAASEVTNALRLGYRHIDTAIGYKNQLGVGHAIHTGIEGLGIPRKEMFVVCVNRILTRAPLRCSSLSSCVHRLYSRLRGARLNPILAGGRFRDE